MSKLKVLASVAQQFIGRESPESHISSHGTTAGRNTNTADNKCCKMANNMDDLYDKALGLYKYLTRISK